MKKLLLAATAGCMIATPALAEDGDWTGGYIGVSVGYTAAKSDSTTALSGAWTTESAALQAEVTSRFAAAQSVDDVNFGGQIGYNYQMGGVVLGVEADIAALSGESVDTRTQASTTFPALSYTYTNRVDPKNMVALKARVGAAMGNTLFYAEGGWAFVKADLGSDLTSNGNYNKSGRLSKTMDGFIVGAGIEHKFASNVSARLSYNYADLGEESYVTGYNPGSAFVTPAYTETMTQDLRMHLVRLGVNFHF